MEDGGRGQTDGHLRGFVCVPCKVSVLATKIASSVFSERELGTSFNLCGLNYSLSPATVPKGACFHSCCPGLSAVLKQPYSHSRARYTGLVVLFFFCLGSVSMNLASERAPLRRYSCFMDLNHISGAAGYGASHRRRLRS